MTEDAVVRQVRAAREAFAAAHGYDVRAMVAALRELDAADDRTVARFASRPPTPGGWDGPPNNLAGATESAPAR